MMTIYSIAEARGALQTLLEKATDEGRVCIEGEDGRRFIVRPEGAKRSALDVEGADLGFSRDEIVELIHESRRR